MAKDTPAAMTPVAAVARHLEWLEFALAAARDEETRRRERLGKATGKNREKRTVRLAEVTAEVRELAALVKGLKDLQVPPAASRLGVRRGAGPAKRTTRATRAKSTAATTAKAPTAAATARPGVRRAATPKPTAAATKPKAAAAKPKASTPAKPKATTTKPATRRRSTKPSTPSA